MRSVRLVRSTIDCRVEFGSCLSISLCILLGPGAEERGKAETASFSSSIETGQCSELSTLAKKRLTSASTLALCSLSWWPEEPVNALDKLSRNISAFSLSVVAVDELEWSGGVLPLVDLLERVSLIFAQNGLLDVRFGPILSRNACHRLHAFSDTAALILDVSELKAGLSELSFRDRFRTSCRSLMSARM